MGRLKRIKGTLVHRLKSLYFCIPSRKHLQQARRRIVSIASKLVPVQMRFVSKPEGTSKSLNNSRTVPIVKSAKSKEELHVQEKKQITKRITATLQQRSPAKPSHYSKNTFIKIGMLVAAVVVLLGIVIGMLYY